MSPKKQQESNHNHLDDENHKKTEPVSYFEKFVRKEREQKLLRESGIRYENGRYFKDIDYLYY